MSILIADSGSTKTDWVVLRQGDIVAKAQTMGFNPYFQTKENITDEIKKNLLPTLQEYLEDLDHIVFYGAGCSTDENKKLLLDAFDEVFECKQVEIHHDLLASARALCGKKSGIACILGTGSNSCLYNGHVIIENVPSVGYLFGDHGSGAAIGKAFVQNYFDGTVPDNLLVAFEKAGYNREVILNNVYKKTMPSKYLASISVFVGQHKNDSFINSLLKNCFSDFFNYQISKYTDSKNHTIHFVGSVAYYYKEIIEEVAMEKGYCIGQVIKSPIQGLIQYHT